MKVCDSIFWVGAAVGCVVNVAREGRQLRQFQGADQREGRGDSSPLYKYNGNLLHPSMFSLWRLLPAVEISAGGRFLSSCGSGKSAGGKLLCRRLDEGVE